MSILRLLSALGVAFKNGAVSFRDYYRDEVDPLTRDALTMAWNRPQFERRRKATPRYALLLIDIDNFKQINDTFGHHAGDVVLRAVARALRTNSGDLVFRVGGEEFAVLLAGCMPADAVRVAERLRKTVLELALLDSAPVTVSVGVAWTSGPKNGSADHDGVYKKADRALYYAKWTGKNRVALFDQCPRVAGENANAKAPTLARGATETSSVQRTLRPWNPPRVPRRPR
jgi:diguanylate cyclase (GGDEF)-like protein